MKKWVKATLTAMSNDVNVIVELDYPNLSTTKIEWFTEISNFLSESTNNEVSPKSIEAALNKREELGTTGFGNGLAIPHGKLEDLSSPYLFFIRLNRSVEWQSLDDTLVNHVFIILVPQQDKANDHLRILSKLSYNLMDDSYQKKIKNENDKNLVLSLIREMFTEKNEE